MRVIPGDFKTSTRVVTSNVRHLSCAAAAAKSLLAPGNARPADTIPLVRRNSRRFITTSGNAKSRFAPDKLHPIWPARKSRGLGPRCNGRVTRPRTKRTNIEERGTTYGFDFHRGLDQVNGRPPTPRPRRATESTRLLARRKLSFRGPDLSLRQSFIARAAEAGAHQAQVAGPLGHHAWFEFHLCAPQSPDKKTRSRCGVRGGTRARRPGDGGQHLSGGHLQRNLFRNSAN